MSAVQYAQIIPTRRVRVTIEADARDMGGRVLRLTIARPDRGLSPGCASLMVSQDWPGVTVEEVAPEHDWRDGDVVQNPRHGWTLTRMFGRWASSMPMPNVPRDAWSDEAVSRSIGAQDHPLVILRYQAGDHQ